MHTPEPQHLLSSIVINYMIFDKNRINEIQHYLKDRYVSDYSSTEIKDKYLRLIEKYC